MKKLVRQITAITLSLILGLALLPGDVSVVWANTGDDSQDVEQEEESEATLELTQITTEDDDHYGYYQISSAADLQTFADYVNTYGGGNDESALKVVLTADIALTGEWTPVYAQYIVFDGNGKTISGLQVSATDSSGLFEALVYSEVSNLTVAGTVSATDGYAGGIAGYVNNTSVISNCTNKCTVTGMWGAGGIAGCAYNSKISDCTNAGSVSSDYTAAGIVASGDEATISNCTNSGVVTSAYYTAAGIVGDCWGCTISDCTNNAVISGSSQVAGIAGCAYETTVSSCANTAAITGKYTVGGIVGYAYGIDMSGCANTGAIAARASAGGIAGVGYDSTFSSCTNSAAISACEEVDGIVGFSDGTTLKSCTNTGAVDSGHNYTMTVTKEATATSTGTMKCYCSKCEDDFTLTIPATSSSSVFTEVNEDSDVKATISADASAYLTTAEQAIVAAGGYACLSLCVIDDTDCYDDESLVDYKNLVVSKVGGTVANTSVYCLWITLTKEVYNASSYSSTNLEELDTPVTITITIPDSVLKDVGSASGVYSIVREHDGEIEILNAVYDASANTLTFSTDKFSTYAIVFTEGVTTSAYTTTPTAATTTSPSTGDSSMLIYLLILAGAAMGGILYARKKRA